MAYILSSTSSTPNTSGNGYAVVMGGGGLNTIGLINFTNGLQGTKATVIAFGGAPTSLTDYLSVKVTYDPSTNGWQLFSRDDGATGFADPTTGTQTSIGTGTDSTYTGTAMSFLGAYWQGSTGAAQTTFFDNTTVTVPPSTTAAGNLQFSQASYNTAEGDSGSHDVTITVTRSCGSVGVVSVQYATSDGTATVGNNDYVAASGTLNWNAGDTAGKTFTVTVKGDTIPESDETVNLTLTNPTGGATLGSPNTATLTILNDDSAPSPTPTATATATPAATATATPIATPTGTPGPTATATATATPIASATAIPTATPSATPTATPTTSPTQPLNISTRLRVEIGDKVMIAGFIITGNSSKTVLLRGLGSSLVNAGLSDVLQDPVLELRSSNGSLIFRNDNWKDDQRSLIEGTPFQPADDRESVIVVTLQPGAYTAVLTGKDQTTGVGLVELYDISQAVDSQLANISTRGFVQTGANVMIGGFILGNSSNTTHVAIVGLGPSLAQFALNNLLEDPTLELHDGNGALIASNDDWIDDPVSAAALITNGLAPGNVKESGIYVSLLPGQFTAILAGKNGGIGVGLVEIYNLR